ncbi:MAG: response regulator [Phototrophicaceae bacterium]
MSTRILYIDDDLTNLDSVARALSRNGFSVITANTGEEGLHFAETEKPDLILLDILLPDMNGFDICEQLRSKPRLKKIPIVALTASHIDNTRRAMLSADFDAYLAKPPALNDLFTTIQQLV